MQILIFNIMCNGSVSDRGKLQYWIYSDIKSTTKIIIAKQFGEVKNWSFSRQQSSIVSCKE